MLAIIDCGSGNTCRNDKKTVKKMIDEIARIDHGKHEIILKFQLWSIYNPQGENIRLEEDVFDYAYWYGNSLGYPVTASVFDLDSLWFLLEHDIPLVKIANRRELYDLVYSVPRRIPVYISYDNPVYLPESLGTQDKKLYCISKYPSDISDYWGEDNLRYLSDHTIDLKLFNTHAWELKVYECHFALEGQKGLDVECGICKTPKMLKEIL